ncbi:polycomb group protein EMBRYONIC FLOWER 2-like [Bidens hawaiensis]|uniref:polycomb group protein EMBRYONIC FLOWER 2-like n=1 Tax=Bidens hawaiensis TaxID=980011 RepID=UPI0040495C9D
MHKSARVFFLQPVFLKRCLSYEREAKLEKEKRIQISVSTSGATTSNVDGSQIQTLFPLYVFPARPVSTTSVETQTAVVYRFKRARKLRVFGGSETAKFILCEMNKLSNEIKSGSIEMLVVSCADSSNSQSMDLTDDHMFSNSLNCSGYCLFGKIPMDSLHSSWENAPPLSLGGRSEMKLFINMKACSMKVCLLWRIK